LRSAFIFTISAKTGDGIATNAANAIAESPEIAMNFFMYMILGYADGGPSAGQPAGPKRRTFGKVP
jgi:hypothetical protein